MSSITVVATGLGIDLSPAESSSVRVSNIFPPQRPLSVRSSLPSSDSTCRSGHSEPCIARNGTLRSAASMSGLVLAEIGDSMVEYDIASGGSGFREGHRIVWESVTPGGGSKRPNHPTSQSFIIQEGSLARHGTLLSADAGPGRKAAELKSILGNVNSRLKPGAAVLPHANTSRAPNEVVSLEQAKPRARVEVDIILESNTIVQGSYVKGLIKLRIRKRAKKEAAVSITGGKVRVIGFECISNTDDRHVFYQCSAPISGITVSSEHIYASGPDEEGFAEAREGVHVLPFAMLLPLDDNYSNGMPKGALHIHSGVAVRYIAMASIKVRNTGTDKRSIAHFYRDCEIWPRLNPSVILAAAPRPLQVTTSKSLFMGGNGQVRLTASLHRLHWVAGQQCYVKVSVMNDSKKTMKSLTLSLIRTTVVFKPNPSLDALPPSHENAADPDACQTSTTQKQVAETTLEMGQCGARGHASAKGWWTGVRPREALDFSYFLPLPSDALSITRGRLLEVEYTIRVSLSAGPMTSDIHVTLPIRIVNFLSVDPPPSSPSIQFEPSGTVNSDTSYILEAAMAYQGHHQHLARPSVDGLFSSYGSHAQGLETLAESDDEDLLPAQSRGFYPEDEYEHDDNGYSDDHSYTEYDASAASDLDGNLGNLAFHDDTDDAVRCAISSGRLNVVHAMSFADLYHASVQEDLHASGMEADLPPLPQESKETGTGLANLLATSGSMSLADGIPVTMGNTAQTLETQSGTYGRRPSRPRGPSSFTARVQEKLGALNISGDRGPLPDQPEARLSANGSLSVKYLAESDCPGHNNYPGRQSAFSEIHNSRSSEIENDSEPSSAGLTAVKPEISTKDSSALLSGSDSALSVHRLPTTGSRLLPRPPSLDNLSLPAATTAPALGTTLNLGPGSTEVNFAGVQVPMPKPEGAASDWRTLDISARPFLASGVGGGSASSVKDKIRELEERARSVGL